MFGVIRWIRRRRRLRGEWFDLLDWDVLTGCSLDYLFQLAVEMRKLGMPWLSDIA